MSIFLRFIKKNHKPFDSTGPSLDLNWTPHGDRSTATEKLRHLNAAPIFLSPIFTSHFQMISRRTNVIIY